MIGARRPSFNGRAFAAALWIAALPLVAGGCLDSVVSAECSAEATACGDVCVDTASDPDNCGGCGLVCDGECSAGLCSSDSPPTGPTAIDDPSMDGSGPEPGDDAPGPKDGPKDGNTIDDAPTVDEPPVPCDLGEESCENQCVFTGNDASNCGGCGIECGDGVCSSGQCVPECEPVEATCDGGCADLASDANHCGACGQACASGLCQAGLCQDAIAGHVIVIGHGLSESNAAMERLLGNSVFLGYGQSVDVVAYTGSARIADIERVDQALDAYALARGSSWNKIEVNQPELVPQALANGDVFLVYAQGQGVSPEQLGDQWQIALDSFTHQGGIVVVLDDGAQGGTYRVLEPAGLFTAVGSSSIVGQVVNLVAPGDAVAIGVPLSYLAPAGSISFSTEMPGTVAQSADGASVVYHRPVF